MNMPDPSSIDPEGPLSRIFSKRLLQALAATMPMGYRDGSPEWAEKWDATRELFDSLNPRNPADAQLAAFGIAAAQSAMDTFARAAQPNLSDEQVMRLRGRALSAGRAFATVLRTLRKAAATEAQQPAIAPRPTLSSADTMTAQEETADQPPDATPAAQPRRNPLAWLQGRTAHTTAEDPHASLTPLHRAALAAIDERERAQAALSAAAGRTS